jgi:hypothetical protein
MANTLTRRPLPALVSLLALLLLTSLVWWRVLHRADGSSHASAPCPTPTPQVVLPAPSSITVEVLNATKRNGIAATARKTLVDIGFKVPALAGNDQPKKKNLGTAQIRYGAASKKDATVLRYYFPGAALVPVTTTRRTVTVSLGPKYKAIASAAAVSAAMKRDKVGLATSSAAPSPSATC